MSGSKKSKQSGSLHLDNAISTPTFHRRLARSTLIIVLILLVPVIPFLVFGPQCEAWITENVLQNPAFAESKVMSGVAVALTLGADILLPVPSSGVMTFAGASLGAVGGTIVSWIGLTLSCTFGFFLGRSFGLPVASRFSKPEELEQVRLQLDQHGKWLLVLFRALPVLAEASVLVAGVYRMKQRNFWPPVLIANLGVAICCSALGSYSQAGGWFGTAFLVSVVAPLLVLLIWLLFTSRLARQSERDG